ncbi:putative disease resistance protein RGA1 [Arachis duranensis]|uniref:Disease resistance protein RGA1 n=1 Tax=Arachis duranensis TaxID=130453 RepID=A0A9C6TA57_ARADU|nr:putative disease resistance protein RGA1 [Arachis duranensis]XP_052112759.1 putative disease resistance protein RGA1 [Arachis duranensis]XP_052112760.1 putative disease resistance protein RGA1 [Arachis duranensis]
MADVSSMITTLLGNVETKYFQDIALIFGLKDELKELQISMGVLSSFLFDTENKHADNMWWTDVRKAVDDARLIFEEIEYEAKRNALVKVHGSIHTKIFQFFSCFRNPDAFRIKIANRIHDMIQKLNELLSQGRERGIIEHVNTPTRELTPAKNLYTWDRFKPVGRLEEKEEIIKLLMRQQSHANNIDMISIVGIGGLGKTTLAQMIYNDDRVKEQFNMLMWVCVSYDFDLRNLIRKIINAASIYNDKGFSLQHMVSLLNEMLHGKRFLLVLDDVWNQDYQKWVQLISSLLEAGSDAKSEGSKIIVTTRSKDVASIDRNAHIIELQPLSEDECWKVFAKFAFEEENEEDKYPWLKQIGKEIVEKCEGLPLAAEVFGSFLCGNHHEMDWQDIKDAEIWELEDRGLLSSLKRSYNHLSPILKQCFSYCSCFPKGYEYTVTDLIMFWMAHGLLQSTHERRHVEDIGRWYIMDLISSSLLQIQGLSFYDFLHLENPMPYEKVKMHGLLYGLAKSTMKELDETRTIVSPWLKEEWKWASKKFNSVKALHLQHMELKILPDDCFANMKLLRYLNLGDCILEKLPISICTLQNLQFLNLHRCYNLQELPKNMENLVSLQVLFLTVNAINLSSLNIGRFQQLKTLFLLDCVNLLSLPAAIGCLSTLRKLLIYGCDELMNFEDEDEEEKQHVEDHYLNLEVLEIVGSHKLEALPNWLKRAGKLESLRIAGTRIKSFPEWFPISSSLERLDIYSCPKLSSLPIAMDRLHLRHLEIVDCPKLWARYNKHTGPDVHKIYRGPHCKVDYYY